MNSSDQNNPSENNSHQNNQQRKGKGRQKLDMVKIENETNLQVTFSKRRFGVFKKASEISTLCGAQAAVVVFSPSGKAHSFGNPNVQSITDRFLNRNPNHLPISHNNPTLNWLNERLNIVEAQLEQEKRRVQELHDMKKARDSQNRPLVPNMDELDYEQLDHLKMSILSFKDNVETHVQNHMSFVQSSYHVQGMMNPNLGTSENLSWPTLNDPNTGFSFGSNLQWPNQFNPYNNHVDQTMFTNEAPFGLVDGGIDNPSVFAPTNPMVNTTYSAPIYPNPMIDNSGVIGPTGPTSDGFGFMVQNPNATNFLPMFSDPNNVVPYGGAGPSNTNFEAGRDPTSNVEDMFRGFTNNPTSNGEDMFRGFTNNLTSNAEDMFRGFTNNYNHDTTSNDEDLFRGFTNNYGRGNNN